MNRRLKLDAVRAADLRTARADLLAVPVREGTADDTALRRLEKEVGSPFLARAREVGFRGQEGRTFIHRLEGAKGPKAIVVIGLGKDPGPESWRRAAAAASNAGVAEAAERIAILVPKADETIAAAIGEGAALARYRFARYRKPEKDKRREPKEVVLVCRDVDPKILRRPLAAVEAMVPAIFAARDLVNEPPSVKSATYLGDRAVEMCRGTATRVEVMGPKKIRALHLNGLLAVNRGSIEEPRFVRLRYRPRGRARAKVALVGKGITFDSGGLSLKPANSMETMKQDMAGAAAVFAIMATIGRLRPPIEVTGYVPSTDNLPSGSAQKPGDVIRYRNGKTVEVLNTDAEGRLILADALALACDEGHRIVIDLATLTGACRIALGTRVAGIMGNDSKLVDAIVEHGRATGEPMWPLPLVKEYRDDLKSSVADLKNVGSGFAGAITAGLFLQEFVDGASWAHLDIAGPAFADKDWPYCPRGGTGFGVRTLVRYLMSL